MLIKDSTCPGIELLPRHNAAVMHGKEAKAGWIRASKPLVARQRIRKRCERAILFMVRKFSIAGVTNDEMRSARTAFRAARLEAARSAGAVLIARGTFVDPGKVFVDVLVPCKIQVDRIVVEQRFKTSKLGTVGDGAAISKHRCLCPMPAVVR